MFDPILFLFCNVKWDNFGPRYFEKYVPHLFHFWENDYLHNKLQFCSKIWNQWRRQRICDARACAYVVKSRPHLGESGGMLPPPGGGWGGCPPPPPPNFFWIIGSLKWHFLHFERANLVYSVAAPSWIRCLQLVLNWCRQKVSLFHLENTDEQR